MSNKLDQVSLNFPISSLIQNRFARLALQLGVRRLDLYAKALEWCSTNKEFKEATKEYYLKGK